MKVLHVAAKGARRGAEMFASDLAGALAENGVAQRVAVLSSDGPIAVPFPVPADVVGGNGRVIPGLRVRGAALRGLSGIIREWRPDVIQAHGGEPLKYALLARRRLGVPIVYRRIGSADYGNRWGMRRAIHARVMQRASCVVAVAEAVRRETIEVFRVAHDRVVTIPNGVDHARLRASSGREQVRAALDIDQRAPVILSLGALTWEKDPLTHLAVTQRVREAHPDVVHLVVGAGPLQGLLEDRVRALGLVGRVRMLGRREDIPDLLSASDTLLLASRTEGMPGVLIEAGMMGVPVAAFALSGVPEVVDDGVTGLLVPPGDVGGLASAVLELLADPERGRGLGDAARRRCMERFDIGIVGPMYLEIYEELAANRSPRRNGELA